MSDFKNYKKADLAKAAVKAGISVRSKDTKQSLLEKIERLLDEFPEKAKELAIPDDDDDLEVVTLVDENDATEEEEEDEEEDDDDEDEVETAKLVAQISENYDEESDKDYNAPPPINLKEWVVDPAIALFESAHDKVLLVTDAIGVTTLDANDELRETLSTTVSLNFLEAAAEASYFLYKNVPLIPVRYNRSIHKVFRDNIPLLNECNCAIPDITALFDFSVVTILGNWILYAVALPLLVSYYVNFSRRVVKFEAEDLFGDDDFDEELDVVDENEDEDEDEDDDDEDDFADFAEDFSVVVRAYKFDPFIFALAKVVIYYYIHKNGALTNLPASSSILQSVRNLVYIQWGIYHTFVTDLGSFPVVTGLANAAIALYSQFEDL